MDSKALKSCSFEELDDAITQMHAALGAVHQSFLELIATFDELKAWEPEGAHSLAGWLSFRLGVSTHTAQGWAKAARALSSLPLVRDAYGQGRITWDHVLALCEVATPSTEEELLDLALESSAGHFRRMSRCLKPVSDLDAREAMEARALSYRWDADQRFLVLHGRLPDLDGAVVAKALDRLTDRIGPDPLTGQYGSIHQNNADALVELCSTYLDASGDQDRATVVVHVDASALSGASGIAEIEGGGAVAAVTARRAACDCRLELVAESSDGKTIGIGRRSRQIPAWLMRQLRRRDEGCRFPGCSRTRWVHAHHLEHWIDGGPTEKDNLVLLCGHHHRLVHDGGWRIRGHPDEFLQFVHPDGRPITGPPPAIWPELKRELFSALGA